MSTIVMESVEQDHRLDANTNDRSPAEDREVRAGLHAAADAARTPWTGMPIPGLTAIPWFSLPLRGSSQVRVASKKRASLFR